MDDMRNFSLFPNVKHGRFIRRLNRFIVECSLDGEIVRAHLPNPGRLWELLLPGRIVSLVSNGPRPGRSTSLYGGCRSAGWHACLASHPEVQCRGEASP